MDWRLEGKSNYSEQKEIASLAEGGPEGAICERVMGTGLWKVEELEEVEVCIR